MHVNKKDQLSGRVYINNNKIQMQEKKWQITESLISQHAKLKCNSHSTQSNRACVERKLKELDEHLSD